MLCQFQLRCWYWVDGAATSSIACETFQSRTKPGRSVTTLARFAVPTLWLFTSLNQTSASVPACALLDSRALFCRTEGDRMFAVAYHCRATAMSGERSVRSRSRRRDSKPTSSWGPASESITERDGRTGATADWRTVGSVGARSGTVPALDVSV